MALRQSVRRSASGGYRIRWVADRLSGRIGGRGFVARARRRIRRSDQQPHRADGQQDQEGDVTHGGPPSSGGFSALLSPSARGTPDLSGRFRAGPGHVRGAAVHQGPRRSDPDVGLPGPRRRVPSGRHGCQGSDGLSTDRPGANSRTSGRGCFSHTRSRRDAVNRVVCGGRTVQRRRRGLNAGWRPRAGPARRPARCPDRRRGPSPSATRRRGRSTARRAAATGRRS